MSGSLNKVMLIGNLGKDPEVKSTPSGAKVANFNVATNESYTDRNGQKVDKTEWHRIVMWRGLAEIAERWLKKGSTVYIEGKLTTRSWDDQSGQKRYTTEIVADNMQMLGRRGEGGGDMPQEPYSGGGSYDQPQGNMGGGASQKSFGPQGNTQPAAPEDDLPF